MKCSTSKKYIVALVVMTCTMGSWRRSAVEAAAPARSYLDIVLERGRARLTALGA